MVVLRRWSLSLQMWLNRTVGRSTAQSLGAFPFSRLLTRLEERVSADDAGQWLLTPRLCSLLFDVSFVCVPTGHIVVQVNDIQPHVQIIWLDEAVWIYVGNVCVPEETEWLLTLAFSPLFSPSLLILLPVLCSQYSSCKCLKCAREYKLAGARVFRCTNDVCVRRGIFLDRDAKAAEVIACLALQAYKVDAGGGGAKPASSRRQGHIGRRRRQQPAADSDLKKPPEPPDPASTGGAASGAAVDDPSEPTDVDGLFLLFFVCSRCCRLMTHAVQCRRIRTLVSAANAPDQLITTSARSSARASARASRSVGTRTSAATCECRCFPLLSPSKCAH